MRMIELLAIAPQQLQALARGETVDFGLPVAPAGGLPPAEVAIRALSRLSAGMPARWCVPWLIVSTGQIAGGCGFKSAPASRCVEIGYGIASSRRREGLATAAVHRLLQQARGSGEVDDVTALIVPDNIASSRVVTALGFVAGPLRDDEDGEQVREWRLRL